MTNANDELMRLADWVESKPSSLLPIIGDVKNFTFVQRELALIVAALRRVARQEVGTEDLHAFILKHSDDWKDERAIARALTAEYSITKRE